ncbi:amino acid permease [Hazenella coriacea]|uniref:Amino acid/polyamine/organocation transporter (APC superfamily) n=1 Tax=Hazenella coriacea TaxID=1179467 RepID=A0A4R3KZU2_9BACL|nr:amino acid permease [Hazenella coriacea]TCS92341.1 amino acid/polyamine/organocation transporter (APC superfamily) [Hazenella coriacea]
MSKNQDELSRGLTPRHITMMALGGVIGAGMFKGSSSSIATAGPGVVVSYLIGGIILLFVMQGLAEMTIRHPHARNFRDLLEPILGRFAGYLAGWMYWITWVLVMAAEITAAAIFLQYWFDHIPLWILSLIISLLITGINLFQVKIYGETEFWLAGIKILVLILFILLGGTLLFTGFSDHAAPGLTNLTAHGGFFPNGIVGIASSMLIVMFSFGGAEMIGMTLGEMKNPEKVVPRIARTVITRIIVFYILPIFVIVSLVPWNQLGENSPFVTVFQAIGIPYVDHIMNFVLLTAVISSANSGMYAASRMLYSQARSGHAPKFLAKLSKQKVPVFALLFSTSFLYIGVIIAFFAKGKTFDYLMVIPAYSMLLIWILLLMAHLKSRSQGIDTNKYHVKFFPFTSWIGLIILGIIFVGITLTTPFYGTIATGITVLIVTLIYPLTIRRSTRATSN